MYLIITYSLESTYREMKLYSIGPKMCTTLAKHGNLSGNEVCGLVDNVTGEFIDGTVWHSCEEWCLSKVIRMI